MSPRSAEMLDRAREGLASAEMQVDGGHAATAVSTAYYAMFHAARAALSERDQNARSHTGTWDLFRRQFVLAGDFDNTLWRAAPRAQARREASDYGAVVFELTEARELLETARSFVAAVERLIG